MTKFEIWKYQLSGVMCTFNMPEWSTVLHVAYDINTESPCIWARHEVEEKDNLVKRHFECVGTGITFDDPKHTFMENIDPTKVIDLLYNYIGTVQLPNGIVLHVHEMTDANAT